MMGRVVNVIVKYQKSRLRTADLLLHMRSVVTRDVGLDTVIPIRDGEIGSVCR